MDFRSAGIKKKKGRVGINDPVLVEQRALPFFEVDFYIDKMGIEISPQGAIWKSEFL